MIWPHAFYFSIDLAKFVRFMLPKVQMICGNKRPLPLCDFRSVCRLRRSYQSFKVCRFSLFLFSNTTMLSMYTKTNFGRYGAKKSSPSTVDRWIDASEPKDNLILIEASRSNSDCDVGHIYPYLIILKLHGTLSLQEYFNCLFCWFY